MLGDQIEKRRTIPSSFKMPPPRREARFPRFRKQENALPFGSAAKRERGIARACYSATGVGAIIARVMMTTPPSSSVWDDALLANPHTVADKRGRVQRMFAAIAPSYDLNNRLHSLWMDQHWRRKTVKLAALKPTDSVVDVACGTGDLTLRFVKQLNRLAAVGSASRTTTPQPGEAVGEAGAPKKTAAMTGGVDFTFEMLPIARHKSGDANVTWINGDALALPLSDASADVVSIAFGIRNVSDPAAAIGEFRRILRPGGRLIILEFSLPTNALLRGLYNFYFRKILPRTATWISGDKTGAYKYLPESVNTFIDRNAMLGMMTKAGFTKVQQHPLTFGVCVCYCGVLPGWGAANPRVFRPMG